MTDQTTVPDQAPMTDVDVQAITAGGAAIRAWLDSQDPDVSRLVFNSSCEEMAEVALRAGGEVYAAADQAASDRALADAGLISMEALPDQGVRVQLAIGVELAAKMAESFRALLDGAGSINYVEQRFVPRDGGEAYTVIVCRPDGKTPHQLRAEAEAQRDHLVGELDRIGLLARSVSKATNAVAGDREDTLETIGRLAARATAALGGHVEQ